MEMTNYWIGSLVDRGNLREWVYETADALPVGVKVGRYSTDNKAFYAVEPYVAHAKPYGLKKDYKPVEIVVYGVAGESLLFKYREPQKVELYDHHDPLAWSTCRFDQTTEGWRFVRSVVKVMKVLITLSKKVAVERRKVERNRAAAKAREGREGTCQICEGAQIVQPTGENKGTLVLHGYTRPGYGHTVGNCYGYHRKPFEVACDALTEWVEMLKQEKAAAQYALAELPRLTSMMVEKNWRDRTLIEIKPGDERWSHAQADRKYRLESEIRQLERDIAHQGGRLDAWKPVAEYVEKWGAL